MFLISTTEQISLENKKEMALVKRIGEKLFEEFLIIGPYKNEFFENDGQKLPTNCSEKTLEPKILFDYPSLEMNSHCPRRQMLPKFVFPFGVHASEIKISNSLCEINKILFSNYHLNEQWEQFFILTMKTDDLSQPTGIYKNVIIESNPLLDACNPQHKMYCICFIHKEYAELENDIKNKQPSSSPLKSFWNKNKKTNMNQFWNTSTVYCFMTFYPFAEYFIQLINQILNYIKIKKLKQFSPKLLDQQSAIQNLDYEYMPKFLTVEISKILEQILETPIPFLGQSLTIPEINQINKNFFFKIPDSYDECQLLEILQGASQVFSYFSTEKFVFLFLAHLFELSLVFLSKNINLLTSTMQIYFSQQFYESKVKRFNAYCDHSNESIQSSKTCPKIYYRYWIHQYQFLWVIQISIYQLLSGINKQKNFLVQENLTYKHKSCIFIVLEEDIEIFNSFVGNCISSELKSKFTRLLFPLFSQLQLQNKTKNENKFENLIYFPTFQQKQVCLDIIQTIREFLKSEILQFLPNKPIFYPDSKVSNAFIKMTYQILNIDEIQKQILLKSGSDKDNIFLSNFLNTQMFSAYFEEQSSEFLTEKKHS